MSYGISVLTLTGITLLSQAAAKRNGGHHPITESAEVVRREVAPQAGGIRETFRLIKSHDGLRFVFLMVVVLGALAGSIFVILTAASISVLNPGTRGMIVGLLLVGTIGSRWDKRWMMVVGCLLMGVFMLGGSIWFSYAIFMPIAFAGGAVLAPVIVSMDTLLQEFVPRGARALVFSTRDTVLGASFMAFNTVGGFSIALLNTVGDTPYA